MMYNSSKEDYMEYKALKKDELVSKLEEQGHLAQAVEAKDVEIEELKKEHRTFKNNVAEDQKKERAKIAELEEKIAKFPNISKFEDAIKKLEEENKKLVAFANQHINVFKNTLKALQGTLDNAIELQDIIVNGVKEK
jgi:FtsZ-binding cell division protein ZapB